MSAGAIRKDLLELTNKSELFCNITHAVVHVTERLQIRNIVFSEISDIDRVSLTGRTRRGETPITSLIACSVHFNSATISSFVCDVSKV